MQKKEFSLDLGDKKLVAEFTDLADQTNGSVLLKYGNTIVLATAVMSKYEKEGGDFFPLSVDYEEKFYATGQIIGGRFMKREGKPSDEAILSGRVVDRTIRPLFEQHIRNEVQVVITVLSLDKYDPDVLGVIAASLALGTSDIPWAGPVSSIRIGQHTGSHFETNPTYEFRNSESKEFDMIVCGKDGNINMIEVGGKEISEKLTIEAFEFASKEIEKIQEWQKGIIKEIGKKKQVLAKPEVPAELVKLFKKEIEPKLDSAIFSGPGNKNINALLDSWLKIYKETYPEAKQSIALDYYEETVNEILHKEAIEKDRRADGRTMDEIRPIFTQAGGLSPILHGSGIFYRGGTHILSVLTLGGPQDTQMIDSMEEQQTQKRFMHHYNFPPYSSGETGRMGGTNRRMIGHGALAEKALEPMIPAKEIFPYTIRLVSEALASNGSTSMGSVCGSTLALMDGGVPIKSPVAGIASGLMMDGKKFKVLTDIQGPEDHHGDMDFKVAGTKNGITAIQMDVKVDGVPIPILVEALEKARKARLQILEKINEAISAPRKDISPNAPKILMMKIKPEQIGLVIGGGGKTINEIKDKTGAQIDIEDDGTVYVTGKNGSSEAAQKIIYEMTREYKRGEKFIGEVVKILDFGAFVRVGYNTEGLVHISEIAPFRIEHVDDYLKEGDKVPVIIKEIDEKKRVNLSIKQADPEFIKKRV